MFQSTKKVTVFKLGKCYKFCTHFSTLLNPFESDEENCNFSILYSTANLSMYKK